MKITDVTVQLVQSACGRKWTLVRVHTDEGLCGIGEATYSHKERVVAAMAPMTEHAPPITPPGEPILSQEERRRLSRRPLFRAGT